MTEEKKVKVLRIQKDSTCLVSVSVFFCLVAIIGWAMQTILSPFLNGFFSQSIGGMGLK